MKLEKEQKEKFDWLLDEMSSHLMKMIQIFRSYTVKDINYHVESIRTDLNIVASYLDKSVFTKENLEIEDLKNCKSHLSETSLKFNHKFNLVNPVNDLVHTELVSTLTVFWADLIGTMKQDNLIELINCFTSWYEVILEYFDCLVTRNRNILYND